MVGNTPTGVGTTVQCSQCITVKQKHPHGRGDDATRTAGWLIELETPPRAWGRQLLAYVLALTYRNTPTGVGTTIASYVAESLIKKHPHGRGDDA